MENCKVKIHLENAPSCCKFRLRAVWRQDPSTIWKKEWKKQKLRQQQRNGNQGIDWQREWLSGAKINGGEKIQHTLKKTAPSPSTSLALCPGLTTCQSVSIAVFLAQSDDRTWRRHSTRIVHCHALLNFGAIREESSGEDASSEPREVTSRMTLRLSRKE